MDGIIPGGLALYYNVRSLLATVIESNSYAAWGDGAGRNTASSLWEAYLLIIFFMTLYHISFWSFSGFFFCMFSSQPDG